MKINGKTALVFDIEVFRNFFCIVIKNTENNKLAKFEISERKNDLSKILKCFLVRDVVWVGYNCINYDSVILNCIIENYMRLKHGTKSYSAICSGLKELSDTIVNSENDEKWKHYKYSDYFKQIDLMTMMFSKKKRCSLKELQVSMRYQDVRESLINFNDFIKNEDQAIETVNYCVNDVLSTEKLLYNLTNQLEFREQIEKKYRVNVISKDDTNLGEEIMLKQYLRKMKIKRNELPKSPAKFRSFYFKELIFDCIKFETKELQNVLDKVKNTKIESIDQDFNINFLLCGVEHNISKGGLHSISKPNKYCIYNSNKIILFKDVQSMYPSLIDKWDLYPQHLGNEFKESYRDLIKDRLEAKANGDKLVANALKLAINCVSGKLQFEDSFIYDPLKAFQMRINGQLFLLMLIEKLSTINSFEIINTNTDGAGFLIDKKDYNKCNEICKEWESITRLTLEEEQFEAIYQYAIGDYLGVGVGYNANPNPELLKKKGLFIDEPTLGKGVKPLIIPKAIINYFINNIPVKDTIMSSNDIFDFCGYQKIDKKFTVFYNNQKVQRINRYYYSVNGGSLYKAVIDYNGNITRKTLIAAGVIVYNHANDNANKINYNYYINEAQKIIDAIEVNQLSLF